MQKRCSAYPSCGGRHPGGMPQPSLEKKRAKKGQKMGKYVQNLREKAQKSSKCPKSCKKIAPIYTWEENSTKYHFQEIQNHSQMHASPPTSFKKKLQKKAKMVKNFEKLKNKIMNKINVPKSKKKYTENFFEKMSKKCTFLKI